MSRTESSIKQAGRSHTYEIDGHVIISSDENLDGPGTAPDRIEDSEHRALEGAERDQFLDHLARDLGISSLAGFSLSRLEGYFRSTSRARDFLESRGYNLGLLQASIAAGHAEDGGFLNETTRGTLRDMVARSLEPGLASAEALLAGSPSPQEIWSLLTQEPFQSLRTRTTLQRLVREGVVDEATLRRTEELFRSLVERGIGQTVSYGEEVLAQGQTPEDFRTAWMVLSGLRNQATRLGLPFDAAAMDRLIRSLEDFFPPDPAQRRIMESLTR